MRGRKPIGKRPASPRAAIPPGLGCAPASARRQAGAFRLCACPPPTAHSKPINTNREQLPCELVSGSRRRRPGSPLAHGGGGVLCRPAPRRGGVVRQAPDQRARAPVHKRARRRRRHYGARAPVHKRARRRRRHYGARARRGGRGGAHSAGPHLLPGKVGPQRPAWARRLGAAAVQRQSRKAPAQNRVVHWRGRHACRGAVRGRQAVPEGRPRRLPQRVPEGMPLARRHKGRRVAAERPSGIPGGVPRPAEAPQADGGGLSRPRLLEQRARDAQQALRGGRAAGRLRRARQGQASAGERRPRRRPHNRHARERQDPNCPRNYRHGRSAAADRVL